MIHKRGPHEPRGLAIEESFWGPYYDEFGDETFMIADVDIDKGQPSERLNQRLIIVLLISMTDESVLERANWLGERSVPYWWVPPKTFTLMRGVAQMPQSCSWKYVHYAN